VTAAVDVRLMRVLGLWVPTVPRAASTSAVLALDTDGGGDTVILHREGHLRGIARDIA
jgi:hypothetical protein